MENNCLVTKLKSTVNDNSLLKVGEMFIDIIEQESPTNITNCLYLDSSSDLVIEVENGEANITLDSNMESGWTNKITLPKSVSALAPVYVRNGNYRLKVFSKYNLIETGRYVPDMKQYAISVDTKYLKYSHGLVNIYSNLSGDISNLKGCTKLKVLGSAALRYSKLTGNLSGLASLTALTIIKLYNCSNITGSLSDLAPLTALTSLSLSSSPNLTGSLSDLAPLTALTSLILPSSPNLTGSLSDLAPLTALTSLSLERANFTGDIKDIRQPLTRLSVYMTNITGELIEFVKTQRAAGRTTGSCNNGGWWGSNITFNGVNPGGGEQTLTWTENTITNNGVTVNQ